MSVGSETHMPPPSSQSHFEKYENFVPDADASFDDEFTRLASSQDWIPGSQQYTKERTIAMREEIKFFYFPSSQPLDGPEVDSAQEQQSTLEGYQALCREVRIPPADSIGDCKRQLKKTLVNLVDLIDARRTSKEVKVWDDFAAFRSYTLEDGKLIDKEEAKRDGGHLSALLQRLGPCRSRRRHRGRSSLSKTTTLSGGITKRRIET